MQGNTSRKKVVHLITLLELGGAQGNTIHTVRNLDPQKFETHLWAGPGAYWDKDVLKDLGEQGRLKFFPRLVRRISPVNDLLVIFDLWFALKKFKPDILHTHSSKAGIVGRIAGWLAGVPAVIHTFHGFGFNDQQNVLVKDAYIFLEKLTARLSDKLIFVSQQNEALAASLQIGNTSQYRLIRSGVPIGKIRLEGSLSDKKELKAQLGIPYDNKVITTIAAFKPQKNISDFIAMAAALSERHAHLSFLIIGDGTLREQLTNQTRRLGLEGKIIMPGWRRDVAQLLAMTDVFVLTSLWEGLPRALVEAMILGVPSVCYDTDGIRDLLSKGGGFIVRQKLTSEMTDRISSILELEPLRIKLSEQARRLVTEDFDIDFMVKQQEELYEEILN